MVDRPQGLFYDFDITYNLFLFAKLTQNNKKVTIKEGALGGSIKGNIKLKPGQ